MDGWMETVLMTTCAQGEEEERTQEDDQRALHSLLYTLYEQRCVSLTHKHTHTPSDRQGATGELLEEGTGTTVPDPRRTPPIQVRPNYTCM
ncbi:hypothetical protein NHX12_018919 [Muraenolepis orangiensis]|uniref:Uncharacterized protein n=1 Tax=Muraenolepis orangiensis TaxID=630683 RepID=A0A9Q0EXF4_9TELE|nr:hypothetical protein NHX12_018919 [Muraenolepis orangiensis]